MKTYKVGSKRYTLSEMRANPRLRGKLPPNLLTPEQQQMRKTNTANKAPAGPGSSLSVKQLADMVKAQYGGTESALNQRKADIPTWFNDYRTQLQGLQAQQQQRTRDAQAAISAFAEQAAKNTQTAVQGQNDRNAQTSAVTGGVADPTAAARQQAAEGVRQAMIGGYGGLATTLGNNQTNYMDSQVTASRGMENNAQGELLKLFTSLGQDKAKYGQDILSNESKSKLEQSLATGKLQDTKADNRRADNDAKERARHNLAKEATDNEKLKLALKKLKLQGKGGVKPKEAKANQDKYDRARQLIGTASKSGANYSEAITLLTGKYNISIPYAKAVAEKAYKKKLSAQSKARLDSDGVRY